MTFINFISLNTYSSNVGEGESASSNVSGKQLALESQVVESVQVSGHLQYGLGLYQHKNTA